MLERRRTCPFLVSRALLVPCLSLAAWSLAQGDAIDEYLRQEQAARQIPGLALAVVRHGAVDRVSTYGLANIETGTPVSPDSVFPIASLDKGITATGVLKAVELGRMSLSDPITKYAELPLPGVDIRMLLSHTSGLPDMDQALAEAYGGREFVRYANDDLLAAIRGATLQPPGGQYAYSDAGLFLAQLATERAVGSPWMEWMQRSLFQPAGMLHVVTFSPRAIIPNRVASYSFDAAQHLVRDGRTEIDYGPLYNDIGMTVGDFAHWVIMLDGHGPLGAASIRTLWTQATLADGSPSREVYAFSGYGLGTGLDDVLGQRVVLHTGHSGVAYVKFPALDLAVVVFTNLEHPMGSDPAGLALAVAGLIDPSVSLRALAAPDSGPPPAARGLRRVYELFLAGKPDLSAYAPALRQTLWRNRETFAGRLPRLGPLASWSFLRQAPVDGEPSFLFRATHAHGEIDIRFSLDGEGRVSRLVWWHL